jgi:hypothetical protein
VVVVDEWHAVVGTMLAHTDDAASSVHSPSLKSAGLQCLTVLALSPFLTNLSTCRWMFGLCAGASEQSSSMDLKSTVHLRKPSQKDPTKGLVGSTRRVNERIVNHLWLRIRTLYVPKPPSEIG